MDSTNGNFHLRSISPCIDAGTTNRAPAADLDGVSRPQGSGVDMGAYEWVSGTPEPPLITTQPTSRTNNAGTTATFEVVATGIPSPGYRWMRNSTNLIDGGNVSGATTAALTMSTVQPSDAGSYTILVTNSSGSVTSAVATLTVLADPPAITGQPQSQTITQGFSAAFTVTASGTLPLSYQWRFNGTNIADATTNSYTLTNVQTNDAGSYSVVVTNVAGSVTSSNAMLTVLAPPSIVAHPQSQTVTQGNNVTFSVTATGTMPLYYRWQFNSANTSSTSNSYSLNNVQLNQTGDYRCIVSNAIGVATSAVATLTVLAPPVITTQPQNLINATGTTARFTVIATGSSPMSYQWRKDDVILGDGGKVSGATSGTLTVTGVADTNAGNYQAVVTNSLGTATSVVARLTVVSVPPPPILGIGVTGTVASISFTGVAGITYTPEYKDALGSTTWTQIPPPVIGNGGVMTRTDTNATVRRRFYRVRVE